MKLTESLSQDHRVIEQVLRCLQEMASRASATGQIDVASAESAIRFIRTFADQCHHMKEEQVLFPALAKKGFGPEAGPVAVMLEEHELGRKYVGRIETALKDGRSGGRAAVEPFVAAVSAFVEVLTQHIAKEDHILFPLADHALGASEGEAVKAGFARAEDSLAHGKLHAEMIGIADELGKRFGVARAAGAAEFKGCCHHPGGH